MGEKRRVDTLSQDVEDLKAVAAARPDVVRSIIVYGLCSSMMLVSNKVAVTSLPLPACLMCFQVTVTIIVVHVLKGAGIFAVDDFTIVRARRWFPYAMSFCLTLYCNTKVLQKSNVETVIVFRACSPLLVSILEYIFLGRQFPAPRSIFSLVFVFLGAAGYVLSDSQFHVDGLWGYNWVFLYLFTVTFEMCFGKFLMSSVHFEAPVWSSVYYTNVLAWPLFVAIAVFSGEIERVGQLKLRSHHALAMIFSTTGGICISWAGWNCRNNTSATTYTLVGVICKLASVALNALIWDKHATPIGILWLNVCLFSSTTYRPAPLRDGGSK